MLAVLMVTALLLLQAVSPTARLCRASKHICFSYNPNSVNGPSYWNNLQGSGCCEGLSQSPVDISSAVASNSCGLNMRVEYQAEAPIIGPFLNNGLYPKFNPQPGGQPVVLSGVPPNASVPYRFSNLHIHCGTRGRKGSEHSVDGVLFDGEIHLVHNVFASRGIPDAATIPSGIAVIAIFLSTTLGEYNQELNNLLRYLPQIRDYYGPGCTPEFRRRPVDFEGFSFSGSERCNYHDDDSDCGKPVSCWLNPARLLPRSGHFYSYQGSLTTPPCSEAVNWVIMRDPLRITVQQLRLLQNLQIINEDVTQIPTYASTRRTQPLNGRPILANFCPGNSEWSGAAAGPID